MVQYIHNTFKTNGFSLNKSNLFLPKFQAGNPLFDEIVKLSKEATINPSVRAANIELLSAAYVELCQSLNPNLTRVNETEDTNREERED